MDGFFIFYCPNLKREDYFKITNFVWKEDGNPELLYSRIDEDGEVIEADCYYRKETSKGLEMYHI